MSAAVAIPLVPADARKAPRRLHVLTLTPFFPSVQDSSQGGFIAEPIGRLEQFGIESRVIAVNPFYRPPRRPCVPKSEWRQYLGLPGNMGLVSSGSLMAAALRSRVLDLHRALPISLIHAHAALPCGDAAMMLARELGIPFVVSVHGLDLFAEKQAGRVLGRWTRRQSLSVYRAAECIVCISKKVSEAIPAELREKVRVVYNGVDSNLFAPAPKEVTPVRVLSVGNLIPIKGHELLLRAFAKACAKMPAIELEIIGDGPEHGRLVGLASELGIRQQVIFQGRRDRLTVSKAMQSCAVFALPSRYEGLGCVYLEAMACAKPAIGCFGQGIEEVIRDGENGKLIPPGNQELLVAALLALLRDTGLRRRLGTAARETVLQGYTLDHQAKGLAGLYRECAP